VQFTVRLDAHRFTDELRRYLEGTEADLRSAQRLTGVGLRTEAGRLLSRFIVDEIVTVLAKQGDQSDAVCAEYWYAKAYLHALGGNKREGQGYFDTAQQLARTGGKWCVLCRTHYN
jgi:hypothetical protein